jgi:hypothetical protein
VREGRSPISLHLLKRRRGGGEASSEDRKKRGPENYLVGWISCIMKLAFTTDI